MKTTTHILTLITVMVAGLFLAPSALLAVDAPPLPGAIFTTDSTCTAVNQNIFDNKEDVYVDGGPAHPGAAGLPDGSYCVQVTDPSGQTVLGKSDPGAVTVVDGEFVQCYQLSSILKTGSSGFTVPGFDDTPNPGGEYKVWVSTDCNFDNNSTKTDNFQVQSTTPTPTPTATPSPTPCPKGEVCVTSFYDANANGIQDNGEQEIAGWQFAAFAHNNLHLAHKETPKCAYVRIGTYRVLERGTKELNWIHTTPIDVEFDVETDYTEEVNFGNVCVGGGGALTLTYWSNSGQQLETRSDFTALTALNLVTAQGTAQDFTGTLVQNKGSLKQFFSGANGTNMANMLSIELAAMKLSVVHGFVNGSALVYAPGLSACGTGGLSPLGFISINDLMTAANQSLLDHPFTPTGSPDWACQETLKKALEDANNNRNFTQSSPCTFSFRQFP